MSAQEHHSGHGNTPAAWTGVVIILLGSVIGGVGIVAWQIWLFWVGVGVMAVGALIGKVMQVMGMGQTSRS